MNALVDVPISERESQTLLKPLLVGSPVTLTVTDPKLRRKKRIDTAVLFISPLTVYGVDDAKLLLSFPGYGSEVIDPATVKALQLYRLGLTMRAAQLLSYELKELFR